MAMPSSACSVDRSAEVQAGAQRCWSESYSSRAATLRPMPTARNTGAASSAPSEYGLSERRAGGFAISDGATAGAGAGEVVGAGIDVDAVGVGGGGDGVASLTTFVGGASGGFAAATGLAAGARSATRSGSLSEPKRSSTSPIASIASTKYSTDAAPAGAVTRARSPDSA